MPSIRDLADKHPELLRGDKKETEDRLSAVEKALDVRLPPDVRWLLSECGYGAVHAVSNIQQSIDDTFRFRASAGLDPRYVVLDDNGDAGVVLLDTSDESGPVVWADWRSADCYIREPATRNCSRAFLPGSKTEYLTWATSRQRMPASGQNQPFASAAEFTR